MIVPFVGSGFGKRERWTQRARHCLQTCWIWLAI